MTPEFNSLLEALSVRLDERLSQMLRAASDRAAAAAELVRDPKMQKKLRRTAHYLLHQAGQAAHMKKAAHMKNGDEQPPAKKG